MNSLWSKLYDGFKDRSYGGLFFLSTVLAIIGSLILGTVIVALNLQQYFPYALPGIGLLAVAWIWRGIRRARIERQNRLRYASLSRDEVRVARSKLLKDRNFKRS
jgi:hypothetical protein